MYYAIEKNKKLKYVASTREIVTLLLYFKREDEQELLIRFIHKLYRFEREQPGTITLRVKRRCNQILDSRKQKELFDLTMG